MICNTLIHHRKSNRLRKYDYSKSGEYFVTICTQEKECSFGNVINDIINLSQIGEIAKNNWEEIQQQYPEIILDEYVIMPNHIHGVIIISRCRDLINQIPTENNYPLMKNSKITLGKIIRSYKARTAKLIHDAGFMEFRWQSLFYDRIVRNGKELNNIRDYIINNPIKWHLDEENPKNKRNLMVARQPLIKKQPDASFTEGLLTRCRFRS